jgi:hypothetical protein
MTSISLISGKDILHLFYENVEYMCAIVISVILE